MTNRKLLNFATVLSLLAGSWAYPQVPKGYVSYDRRPDIFKVTPKEHSFLIQSWESMKRGHLEAVAQVLELYPEHEIYFLARDSELLYDFAKLSTVDEPSVAKRIHLLNVSRMNVEADHIKDYLAQEGISVEALKSGKKVLFVDTGLRGSIPNQIQHYFPEKYRSSLQTHLLVSSNPNHPSTRTFLQSFIPQAFEVPPASLGTKILKYEDLPRFTDRSDRFVNLKGKWVPLSSTRESTYDGSVDPKQAGEYQESLASYQQKKETRELFQERREIYRKLYQVKDQPDQLRNELLILLNHSDPYNKALAIDFLEVQRLQYRRQAISPEDLGVVIHEKVRLSKSAFIAQYPQWKQIIEKPSVEVPILIQKKDYATLAKINDLTDDTFYLLQFNRVLGIHGSANEAEKKLVLDMIEMGQHFFVSEYILSQPQWKDVELVRLVMEENDSAYGLAHYVLSKEHWVDHPELVEALIREGYGEVVTDYILSQPHWRTHPELVEAVLKKGNADRMVAMAIVSQPQWADHPEFLAMVIKNGNVKSDLMNQLIAEPHWQNSPHFKKLCPQGVTLECIKEKLRSSKDDVLSCNDLLKGSIQ